jgi:hypothetical protein
VTTIELARMLSYFRTDGRHIRKKLSREGLARLGITNKVLSRTAAQRDPLRYVVLDAHVRYARLATHESVRRGACRSRLYFEKPPPVGIRGVPRWRICDIDEAGVKAQEANRGRGWAARGSKAHAVQFWTRDYKLNLLLAVTPLGVVAKWVYPQNTTTQV